MLRIARKCAKSKCPWKTFNISASYPNCFELLKSSSKKIFTTCRNRPPDAYHHNTQNFRNHSPNVSVQDQASGTVKLHDLLQRKQFAGWCLQNLWSDPNFLRRIVFYDECVFHVSDIANSKNARLWGTENPLLEENQVHSAKITSRCGIHANEV